jgi:branched-chain amino acid transport system ATP-binding protein
MGRPELLLIDELSLGLAPVVVERLAEAVREVHRAGTTILLVEQDVQTALEMAARGYVIANGRVAMQGASAELLRSPEIREAYLGI